MTSCSREVIVPLYYAALRPYLEHCIQLWGPYQMKNTDLLEQIQRRATKVLRRMKLLSNEDTLGELGLFSLENKSLERDLIVTFLYLKRAHKKAGEALSNTESQNEGSKEQE